MITSEVIEWSGTHTEPHKLIGASPSFLNAVAMLPTIAACPAAVLILGETGTGKEVFARAIHTLSPRAARPWVAVNCAAIPMELMESEFFGHVRGAFTSAYTPRPGMIREAEGGTLFLDEVDSLSANAQAKLLRLVQEKEYRPVGGSGVSHADVRIIAATNRDIGSLVKAGSFRQDLYFRLNVLNVVLPPLRERRDDIPLLVGHFALKFGRQEGIAAFAQEALCQLHTYDWPGNIRELRNVVERAVLLSAGAIVRPVHLGLTATPYDPGTESFRAAKARVVADFERSYIEQLLAAYRGNVTHAARFAKKNRRAFFELMRKHKIQPETFR